MPAFGLGKARKSEKVSKATHTAKQRLHTNLTYQYLSSLIAIDVISIC